MPYSLMSYDSHDMYQTDVNKYEDLQENALTLATFHQGSLSETAQ